MSSSSSGVAVQRLRQERKAIRRERPVGFFVRKRQASARESPRCDVLRTKLTDIGPPVDVTLYGPQAKPTRKADGSNNLLEWTAGIPGKDGVRA